MLGLIATVSVGGFVMNELHLMRMYTDVDIVLYFVRIAATASAYST